MFGTLSMRVASLMASLIGLGGLFVAVYNYNTTLEDCRLRIVLELPWKWQLFEAYFWVVAACVYLAGLMWIIIMAEDE